MISSPLRVVGEWSTLSLVMLFGMPAEAQCSKDIECKGDRICVSGNCVDPAPAPSAIQGPTAPTYHAPSFQPISPVNQMVPVPQRAAPEYQRPGLPTYRPETSEYPASASGSHVRVYEVPEVPAPGRSLRWYGTAYGHIGMTLGIHGWGGEGFSDSTDAGSVGILLAGYVPASPYVHLGGYFAFSHGDIKEPDGPYGVEWASNHYSIGFSFKAGNRLAERVWLGFVGDVGFCAFDRPGSRAAYGIEVSPRIHLDVLALGVGGFKMGPFVSFGPSVVPYAANLDGDDAIHLVYVQLLLGVTFGT